MLKTIGAAHRTPSGFKETKMSTGHTGSCKTIDDYLWKGPKNKNIETYLESGHNHPNRPLAFRKTNDLVHSDAHGWSKEMDSLRKAWNKDHGRTYYHFVISADPKDHVGADELADLGLEWVNKVLPETQAIVSVHDDNENGIMHAHVIVNSVYPKTGYKVHRTDKDIEHEADICQDLCKKYGLSTLPYLRERKKQLRDGMRPSMSDQPSHKSKAELEMQARGAHSWMADIRSTVDSCVATSHTWAGFESAMNEKGYQIKRPRRGGIVFVHPDSTGYTMRANAAKMGTDYCYEGILARMEFNLNDLASGVIDEQTYVKKLDEAKTYAAKTRQAPALHPYRHPGPLSIVELAQIGVHRKSRAFSKAHINRTLASINTIKKHRVTSISQVDELINDLNQKVIAADAYADVLQQQISKAKMLLELSRQADTAQKEIDSLPSGVWAITTRLHRNNLEKTVSQNREKVRMGLESAQDYIKTNLSVYYPDTYNLEQILKFLHTRAEQTSSEVENLKKEIADCRRTYTFIAGKRHELNLNEKAATPCTGMPSANTFRPIAKVQTTPKAVIKLLDDETRVRAKIYKSMGMKSSVSQPEKTTTQHTERSHKNAPMRW